MMVMMMVMVGRGWEDCRCRVNGDDGRKER